MEWFLVKIVLGQFIMWSILFRTSTNASTKSLDGFDFSSEDVSNVPRKTHQSNPRPKENPQEFITNIFHEVGHTSPQKIYKKVYNETTMTKVCFKTTIYVKQNNLRKGHMEAWREYEVFFDFDFDGKDILERQINETKNAVFVLRVRDPDTGSNEFLNFTVFEKTREFTISKNEKISCGTGKFLVKSYYEWPGSDKRKVVLTLSEDDSGLMHKKDEHFGNGLKEHKPKVDKDESVGSRPPKHRTYDSDVTINEQNQIEQTNNENSPTFSFIVSDNDSENRNQNINVVNFNTKEEPEDSVSIDKNYQVDDPEIEEENSKPDDSDDVVGISHISYDSDEESDANELFYPEYEDNTGKDTKPSFNRTQLEDLCSPILSQLLTGKKSRNGVIPGLCNLKKDERVMIKGDVIVSKRVYNKANKTTTEKKLYIIHENTEIRPMRDQPEKDSKKHKKKNHEDTDNRIDNF